MRLALPVYSYTWIRAQPLERVALWGLLVVSILVHLPSLHNPLITIDAWRQTDEESVVFHFVHDTMNILHPQFFYDGSSGQSVQLELQVLPWLTAGVMRLFGWHVPLLHVAPSLCFTINVWLVYHLGARLANARIGLVAALCYLLIPYDIYYGQALMPEVFMTTCMLWLVLAFDRWTRKPSWTTTLYCTGVLTLTMLAKLPAVTVLPGVLALVVGRCGWRSLASWKALVCIVVSIGIVYGYMAYEGANAAHTFVSGDTDAYFLKHIGGILHPSKYAQAFIFMSTNALGYAVTLGALISLGQLFYTSALAKSAPSTQAVRLFNRVSAWWALCGFCFVTWVATNNALHYYYMVMTVPAALLCANALVTLWTRASRFTRMVVPVLVAGMVAFCAYATPPMYTPAEAAPYALGLHLARILPKTADIVWVGPDPMIFDYAKRDGWRWLSSDNPRAFRGWLADKQQHGAVVVVVEDTAQYPRIVSDLQAHQPFAQYAGYTVYQLGR
ncbi:ArnT family glycosyltransferase [Alicyclobacillus suci]|uniref:ArnT family glycosyltransferase n=1 Tax=Alicyclobacillus suci TaxID=2816080 RepID=UPI001A8E4613|nr:glycosyltransferase family 39 protein [Alicyclobacillus suci]